MHPTPRRTLTSSPPVSTAPSPAPVVTRAARSAPARRNHVGTISLAIAIVGTLGCRVAIAAGIAPTWLTLLSAAFEAAVVGGLADWFAVTALFRHPLGLPIPHTAIIPARRQKIVEGIVSMVEDEWLSPDVIGSRLERFAPSALVVDWLADRTHVHRLGEPVRDLLRALARMLNEREVVEFLNRALQDQLRELPVDPSAGRWLVHVVESESAGAAFESVALSLANLAERPRTSAQLHWWLERGARTLRAEGKRLVPLLLRRKVVQRKIVEAACGYASAELRGAAEDAAHPLRALVMNAVRSYASRLADGDVDATAQARRLRQAAVESLESTPLVREMLTQLRSRLEHDLGASEGDLADLIDRRLRTGILDLLEDGERRDAFDRWVRRTAHDVLRRHHHQIGLTVRENLEALETNALVAQIEDRVGADLQFIRLNGAVVGGLIGLLLAALRFLGG